ncbi:pheST operon leader peptide PheM [Escherichia coli]
MNADIFRFFFYFST